MSMVPKSWYFSPILQASYLLNLLELWWYYCVEIFYSVMTLENCQCCSTCVCMASVQIWSFSCAAADWRCHSFSLRTNFCLVFWSLQTFCFLALLWLIGDVKRKTWSASCVCRASESSRGCFGRAGCERGRVVNCLLTSRDTYFPFMVDIAAIPSYAGTDGTGWGCHADVWLCALVVYFCGLGLKELVRRRPAIGDTWFTLALPCKLWCWCLPALP